MNIKPPNELIDDIVVAALNESGYDEPFLGPRTQAARQAILDAFSKAAGNPQGLREALDIIEKAHDGRHIADGGASRWMAANQAMHVLRSALATPLPDTAQGQARKSANLDASRILCDWGVEKLRAEKAEADRDRLKAALERYGSHVHGNPGGAICDRAKHSDYPCTCGFESALSLP